MNNIKENSGVSFRYLVTRNVVENIRGVFVGLVIDKSGNNPHIRVLVNGEYRDFYIHYVRELKNVENIGVMEETDKANNKELSWSL